jgi:type VI secretion system protein VasJ
MTPSRESFSERAQAWLAPISTEAPCGAPVRQHPTYEAVFTEVAKLESPTGDSVRWEEVVQGAGELLKTATKDLWLGSYFAYGLYATEGFSGAITGTTLLAELTERYWDGLFPDLKRVRSRGLAVSWYVQHLARVLSTAPAGSVAAEQVDALASAVSRLGEVSRARMAAHSPAIGPLMSSLQRLRGEPAAAPTPAAPAAPAEPAPAQAAAAPTPSAPPPPTPAPAKAAPVPQLPAAPTAELGSAEGATDFLRNVGTSLASAAGLLRRANPADALAYRILRTGLWLHVAQLPPLGANGRTSIPPLPAPLRTKLDKLAGNARWAELLDESESAMPQHRFALDLQRFSAHALESLGPSHAAAREAVILELAALLKRLPDVVELVAADGTALTDEASREWLKKEVLARPTATPPPPTPALPLPTAEAESSPSSGRARFVSRLATARACAQAGQTHTARALYEALDAECTALALDAWEPALAAAFLEGYLTTVTPGKDFTESLAGENWIRYRRLALLDAAAASRLHP